MTNVQAHNSQLLRHYFVKIIDATVFATSCLGRKIRVYQGTLISCNRVASLTSTAYSKTRFRSANKVCCRQYITFILIKNCQIFTLKTISTTLTYLTTWTKLALTPTLFNNSYTNCLINKCITSAASVDIASI